MTNTHIPIRIILDWTPDAKHSIIWAADRAGYFEQEGLLSLHDNNMYAPEHIKHKKIGIGPSPASEKGRFRRSGPVDFTVRKRVH